MIVLLSAFRRTGSLSSHLSIAHQKEETISIGKNTSQTKKGRHGRICSLFAQQSAQPPFVNSVPASNNVVTWHSSYSIPFQGWDYCMMCVSLSSKTGLLWSETLWLKNEHNHFKNTYYHAMDSKQSNCHENRQLGKAHRGRNNTLRSWNLMENDSKDLMSSLAIKWSLL